MKKTIVIAVPIDVYEKANEIAKLGGSKSLEDRIAMIVHYFSYLHNIVENGDEERLDESCKTVQMAKHLGMSFQDTVESLRAIFQRKRQKDSEN